MKKLFAIITASLLSASLLAQPQGQRPPMGDGQPPEGMGPGGMQKPKKEKKKKAEDSEKTLTNVVDRLYVYGVAFSPTDSTIYITDELLVEGMSMEKKTKFLVHRDELSRQLQQHLAANGVENAVGSVTYNIKLSALDKQYLKQTARLKKRGYVVKSVDQTQFRFTAVPID